MQCRYDDIMTVYSAQGSQAENVHVHAKLFKGERNLLYTACTRAMKKLKISGIALDDDGIELTTKMELHPKSVLWQVDLGDVLFARAHRRGAQAGAEGSRKGGAERGRAQRWPPWRHALKRSLA